MVRSTFIAIDIISFAFGLILLPFVKVEFIEAGGPAIFQSTASLLRLISVLIVKSEVLGLLLLITLVLLPLVKRIMLLVDVTQLFPTRVSPHLSTIVNHWSLLPIAYVAVVVISMKQESNELPTVLPGTGFLLLLISEFIHQLTRHAEKRISRAPIVLSSSRQAACLLLVYFSFLLLVLGLIEPLVTIVPMHSANPGKFGSVGPISIVTGIKKIFDSQDYAIAGVLLAFSVLFPLAKMVSLAYMLNFLNRIPLNVITWLERLGPWSMLDAVAVLLVVGAFATISIANLGANFGVGLWCFVGSVVLNSLAMTILTAGSIGERDGNG